MVFKTRLLGRGIQPPIKRPSFPSPFDVGQVPLVSFWELSILAETLFPLGSPACSLGHQTDDWRWYQL